MDIKKLLQDWGFNAIAMLAGVIGAFIAIMMNEKEISFRSALLQLLCAVALSGYGTEFLVSKLSWEPGPSSCGLMGLCLGIGGLGFAKGIRTLSKKFEKNPDKYINQLNKKGGDDDLADN